MELGQKHNLSAEQKNPSSPPHSNVPLMEPLMQTPRNMTRDHLRGNLGQHRHLPNDNSRIHGKSRSWYVHLSTHVYDHHFNRRRIAGSVPGSLQPKSITATFFRTIQPRPTLFFHCVATIWMISSRLELFTGCPLPVSNLIASVEIKRPITTVVSWAAARPFSQLEMSASSTAVKGFVSLTIVQ